MLKEKFVENVCPDMSTVFYKYRRAYMKNFMAMSLLCADNTDEENERAEELMHEAEKTATLFERLFDIPANIRYEVCEEAERIARERRMAKSHTYLLLKKYVYRGETTDEK